VVVAVLDGQGKLLCNVPIAIAPLSLEIQDDSTPESNPAPRLPLQQPFEAAPVLEAAPIQVRTLESRERICLQQSPGRALEPSNEDYPSELLGVVRYETETIDLYRAWRTTR
jgi:hypothetical protein